MVREGTHRAGKFLCILLLVFLVPSIGLAEEKMPAPVALRGLSHTSTADSVRVVLNLSGAAEITKNTLANPDRVFLDLKNVRLNKSLPQVIPFKDGIVKSLRVGQFSPTTVRVVFDLSVKDCDIKINNREAPSNLVIEVSRRKAVKDGAESKAPAKPEREEPKPQVRPEEKSEPQPEPKPEVKPDPKSEPKPEASYFRRRVVIDAGHGGDDPGAVGRNGLYEKDVVLDIALRVRDLLKREQQAYDVILTRDRDVFVPLPDRAAVANRSLADLFVSIHANASPKRQTRGIETYLLNYTNDAEAMRVAARENAISFKKMREVQNDLGFILASLERESKRDDSVRLAGYLQNSLASSICSRYPQVYNLGVKQALFYVLVDARMPSALVEVSFISNREEEKLLSEAAYRQRLAEAIAKGIREYFGAEAPLKVASGRAGAGSQKSYGLKPVSYAKRQKS